MSLYSILVCILVSVFFQSCIVFHQVCVSLEYELSFFKATYVLRS